MESPDPKEALPSVSPENSNFNYLIKDHQNRVARLIIIK